MLVLEDYWRSRQLQSLRPNSIAGLLELCLRFTYFCFGGQIHEQREGAAMGSPVLAVVANLYMEHFEKLALKNAPSQPRLWKRYVDDTCCIIRSETVKEFHHHINSVRPSIQFRVELERDGALLFLDTTYLQRRGDGGLDISVYRKPTHTQITIYTLDPIIQDM